MQRRILQIVLSVTVALSMVLAFGASVPALASSPAQQPKPQFAYDPDTGRLLFVGAPAGQPIPASELGALSTEGALGFVKMYGRQFGLSDPGRELVPEAVGSGTFGETQVSRYQQVFEGVPVFGGSMVVSTNKAGSLLGMQGKVVKGLSLSVAAPDGSDVRAQDAAKALVLKNYASKYRVTADRLSVGAASLWIYDEKMFKDSKLAPQLVWKVEVRATNGAPVREVVLVNAQTGNVAVSYNQVDEQWSRPKSVTAPTRTQSPLTPLSGGTALWSVYSANNDWYVPRDAYYTFLCDETTDCSFDWQADDAGYFAGATYNLFWGLGRDSLDNAGMRLYNNIHLGGYALSSNWYFNAFWDGSEMYYGEWMAVDDVVGHELSHGVTEHSSNLIYMFQPGAINESLSDVFGQFVDLTNGGDYIDGCDTIPSCRWLLGEDVLATYPPYYAFRDMKNPPHFGDPDKMSSSLYFKMPFDNGGVHYNSGVNNKAAYLLTDGGTFNMKKVMGLGINKVARIYYQAEFAHLFPSADYMDLYYALGAACNDLYPGSGGSLSFECTQVKAATEAVQMNKRLTALSGPVVTACPAGQVYKNQQFGDDFESGLANWSLSARGADQNLTWGTITSAWNTTDAVGYMGATANHVLHTPGPPALNDCWLDNYGYPVCNPGGLLSAEESVALASTVSIPAYPQKTYLTFDHMYIFDTSKFGTRWIYWDGGVLEYSKDGGTTWLSAKPLFNAGVNYNGPVLKMNWIYEVNPLKGLPGFVGGSRNDALKMRYNLSSLAGQNIKLRFRAGYEMITAQGWYIDNVDIHTCVALPAKPLLKAPPTASHPFAASALVLKWGPVANVSYYEVEVDDDPLFGSPLVGPTSTGTTTQYTISGGTLSPLVKYYWRVRSVVSTDLGPQSKGWTGAWNFTPK